MYNNGFEGDNYNFGNQTINNNQINITNQNNPIPINTCIEKNSKSLGNYFMCLIVNIVGILADISTIISFFKGSDKSNIIEKYFDIFQDHSLTIYLFIIMFLLITLLVILIKLKTKKGFSKFVIVNNKIKYIKTKKCPQCNHNTTKKLKIKRTARDDFEFVCKNNTQHNINIDYGYIIDYID